MGSGRLGSLGRTTKFSRSVKFAWACWARPIRAVAKGEVGADYLKPALSVANVPADVEKGGAALLTLSR